MQDLIDMAKTRAARCDRLLNVLRAEILISQESPRLLVQHMIVSPSEYQAMYERAKDLNDWAYGKEWRYKRMAYTFNQYNGRCKCCTC